MGLPGTEWAVESIDGQRVANEMSLVFSDRGGSTVVTPCRTEPLGFTMNTDGSSIEFDLPETPAGACDDVSAREDSALFEALAATENWTVLNDAEIELRGPPVVRLYQTAGPPSRRSEP